MIFRKKRVLNRFEAPSGRTSRIFSAHRGAAGARGASEGRGEGSRPSRGSGGVLGIIDQPQEQKVSVHSSQDGEMRSPMRLSDSDEQDLLLEGQPETPEPSSDEDLSQETRAKKRKRREYYQMKVSLIRSAPGRCQASG